MERLQKKQAALRQAIDKIIAAASDPLQSPTIKSERRSRIEALEVPTICGDLLQPSDDFTARIAHEQGLQLADTVPDGYHPGVGVELLIGAEPGEISPQLRSFWELQHPGIVDNAQLTAKNDNVLRAFEENIVHKNGRYEVTLPSRENAADLTAKKSTPEPLMNLEDHSSLTRVLFVTGWVRRFIQNCRSQSKLTGELTAAEVSDAENIWKKACQLDAFRNDVRALRAARLLDRG
ncbi:hypothetical protein HPB49_007940 [Dermacentor silvarum]|uniref:Uncharacterized protein n=1 Tax=Dermacentor silvarum TaxID=543639 RepID=A0ACB8DXQ3_DERSI|nr:hypothetical protein HPB49_007940 [Dermacentor silvarum]